MRFPDDVPVLTAGDVTLRPHHVDDADALIEQCTDPDSVRWTTVPLDYSREMAVEWLTTRVPAAWENETEWLFAIEATHPDGGRRFGGSLSLRDEGDNRAEVAFGAHPGVRGRGVMTAAVNLLLDYGFEQRNLETVVWYADKGNFASRRIAWKTGFTFAGTLRKWLPQRGDYHDGWSATLHRDDPRKPQSIWYDVPVIDGRRVRLRAMQESDVPRIAEACADERTQHWLALMPRDYTENDARDYLEVLNEGLAAGTWIQWAVADVDSDALLGHVGIPRITRDVGEIGYWAHPDARGRGAMTEAVRMVVRHAFLGADVGGLGMRRLFLRAARGNDASLHVAEANGFVRSGVERQGIPLGDGSYADLVVYDMVSSEWAQRQAG